MGWREQTEIAAADLVVARRARSGKLALPEPGRATRSGALRFIANRRYLGPAMAPGRILDRRSS